MPNPDKPRLAVTPARSGRPRTTHRLLRPDDLVRVEVRMPASVAANLYQLARDTGQPVSQTASRLLASALEDYGGERPA